jgi:predicted DNA-binding transcriptional regulator YafY
MPANKNQLLRLHVIIEMMRKNSFPNYNRFMAEMRRRDSAGVYKLSEKTFRRDVATLRNEFDAPIEYEPSEHGFFLVDLEWYSEKLMVEPFELKGAVLGQMAAQSIMPDPLRSEINKAVQALLSRNKTGFSDLADLSMMQIINPVKLPLSAETFCTVFNAWERRRCLRLNYCNAQDQESDKIVEPQVLAWQAGVWYIKGWLVGTPKYRYKKPYESILALHRIRAAEMTEESFASDKQLLSGISDGKFFNFPALGEVCLQIQAEVAKPFRERYGNTPGCIQEEADGSLLLTLPGLAEYEAIEMIFRARGQVKVLSPDSLRQSAMDIAHSFLRLQD